MPPVVASHFDAAGHATGYLGKEAFLYSFLWALGILNGVQGLLYFFIPKVSPQYLNLPGKAQWLADPGHLSLLKARLRSVIALTALFANAAFFFALQVVYQANVPGSAWVLPVPAGLAVIALLGIFTLGLLFVMLKPPAPKA